MRDAEIHDSEVWVPSSDYRRLDISRLPAGCKLDNVLL